MEVTTNGAHFQRFLCTLQQMKHRIPNLSHLIRPLHDLLEKIYTISGKRTKTAAGKVPIEVAGWGNNDADWFAK